jgi:hypothetical protein
LSIQRSSTSLEVPNRFSAEFDEFPEWDFRFQPLSQRLYLSDKAEVVFTKIKEGMMGIGYALCVFRVPHQVLREAPVFLRSRDNQINVGQLAGGQTTILHKHPPGRSLNIFNDRQRLSFRRREC